MSVGQPQKTASFPPDQIEFIQLVPKAGGQGDVFFTMLRGGRIGSGRRQRWKHGFLDIAKAQEVAGLMSRTFPQQT